MIKALVFFFILGISLNLNAQKPRTSGDSIKVFYDSLFSTLKSGYLYKDTINWQGVEDQTNQNLISYTDFKTSLNEIETLFMNIGATHCAIYYNGNNYSIKAPISPESYSDEWKKKYSTKPGFEANVINGRYGYILMPALIFHDTKPRNVNKIAQRLYDQIAAIKNRNELAGWIIDLRFNTGGNSWPMLLALYDFLGDNDISASLNVDKKTVGMASLSNGNYVVDSVKQFHINPKGKLLDKVKVAIITGVVTASSGEVVAIAFKGRPNTIFIGENSLGYTSANYGVALPFGTIMTLTKSFNSDRNGVYYDKIIPDIAVSKQDNFDNVLLDKNIQEAIRFIDSEAAAQ